MRRAVPLPHLILLYGFEIDGYNAMKQFSTVKLNDTLNTFLNVGNVSCLKDFNFVAYKTLRVASLFVDRAAMKQ